MTELSIADALKQGISAHQAGRVEEADRYYTSILQVQPEHPDANHNLGVLAIGVLAWGASVFGPAITSTFGG